MHFSRAAVSLFALISFTSAQGDADSLAIRKAEFLQARDDYLEARENYIMEKRGINLSRPSVFPKGVCAGGSSKPYTCFEKLIDRTQRDCGKCKSNAKFGASCECTK